MEEVNLVVEALKFMVLGMGIVFLFLLIMIFALKLQARIIAKLFPLKENNISDKASISQASELDDSAITAAITAAIIHYNKG